MAKKNVNQEEIVVAEAVSKTEKWFQKNGKIVTIVIAALVILGIGGWCYKYFVLDKQEAEAQELIIAAQDRLAVEDPDFALALNGDENGAGFLDIIEKYDSTDAGNLACHYAGICYLRLGDLENAAKYLEMYDAPFWPSEAEEVIIAQNLGLQGDVAVENGDYAKAASLFGEAIEASENEYLVPYFLLKQARAYEAAGQADKAQACYKSITEKYPKSAEKTEAETLLQ